MTGPIPLTGSALEIQRRLELGHPVPHIVETGRWKRAWTLDDVLAVAEHMRHQRARNEAAHRRAQAEVPAKQREQCGTPAGYKKHQRNHEQICEACRVAHNAYCAAAKKKHGTRTAYVRGCRCEPCKQAESAYKEQRRRVAAS